MASLKDAIKSSGWGREQVKKHFGVSERQYFRWIAGQAGPHKDHVSLIVADLAAHASGKPCLLEAVREA